MRVQEVEGGVLVGPASAGTRRTPEAVLECVALTKVYHMGVEEPSAFTRLSALGVEEQRVNVLIDLDPTPPSAESPGDGYRVEVAITVLQRADRLLVPLGGVHRRASASSSIPRTKWKTGCG